MRILAVFAVIAVVGALGSVAQNVQPAAPGPAQYRSTELLLSDVQRQLLEACPAGAHIEWQRNAWAPRRWAWGALTTGGNVTGNVPTVMVVANMHAREVVTAEVTAQLVQELCVGEMDDYRPVRWVVVPIVNEAGRRRVDSGHYCQRTAVDGTDLNRNFGALWGEAGNDSAEVYPGPEPWSAPETRQVRDLVKEMTPTLFVQLHSGTRAIYMPSDCARSPVDTVAALKRVARPVNTQYCNCPMGAGATTAPYRSCGTASDWAYMDGDVPAAYTLEVWSDDRRRDCWRHFNPQTASELQHVTERWADAVLMLARRAVDEFTHD